MAKKRQIIWVWGLLLCLMASLDAEAAARSIKVNGYSILQNGASMEGVSYDAGTNTLTLDSLTLSKGGINVVGDINIELKGNTQIVGVKGAGFNIAGSAGITGDGTVQMRDCGYCGILVSDELTLKGGTIAIYGQQGIEADKVVMQGGTLTAAATTSHAVQARNGLTITGGSLFASSESVNTIQIEDGAFLLEGGSAQIHPANDVPPIYAGEKIAVHGGMIKLGGNMGRQITLKNGALVSLGTGFWFSPDTLYKVTVKGGSGSGSYRAGDTVTISAPSNPTRKFKYWLNDRPEIPVSIVDVKSGTATFVMPIADVEVSAYFSEAVPAGVCFSVQRDSYKVINGTFDNPTVAYWKPVRREKDTRTKITIPEEVSYKGVSYSVIQISGQAFCKNKTVKSVVIGSRVAKIGKKAFENCKALSDVTIGTGVRAIESKAFSGCSRLSNITIKSKKLKTVKGGAFHKIAPKAVIRVPSGKWKAYKSLLKKSSVKLPKKAKIKK